MVLSTGVGRNCCCTVFLYPLVTLAFLSSQLCVAEAGLGGLRLDLRLEASRRTSGDVGWVGRCGLKLARPAKKQLRSKSSLDVPHVSRYLIPIWTEI